MRSYAIPAFVAVSLLSLGGCGRTGPADSWSKTIREMQIDPVFPPREDLEVGDIFMSRVSRTYFQPTGMRGNVNTVQSSPLIEGRYLPIPNHLASVDVRDALKSYYLTRLSFPHTATGSTQAPRYPSGREVEAAKTSLAAAEAAYKTKIPDDNTRATYESLLAQRDFQSAISASLVKLDGDARAELRALGVDSTDSTMAAYAKASDALAAFLAKRNARDEAVTMHLAAVAFVKDPKNANAGDALKAAQATVSGFASLHASQVKELTSAHAALATAGSGLLQAPTTHDQNGKTIPAVNNLRDYIDNMLKAQDARDKALEKRDDIIKAIATATTGNDKDTLISATAALSPAVEDLKGKETALATSETQVSTTIERVRSLQRLLLEINGTKDSTGKSLTPGTLTKANDAKSALDTEIVALLTGVKANPPSAAEAESAKVAVDNAVKKLSQVTASYTAFPDEYADPDLYGTPLVLRLPSVYFPEYSYTTFSSEDFAALAPLKTIIGSFAFSNQEAATGTLKIRDACSYGLPADQVKRLADLHLQTHPEFWKSMRPKHGDRKKYEVYVVTEVYLARALEVSLQSTSGTSAGLTIDATAYFSSLSGVGSDRVTAAVKAVKDRNNGTVPAQINASDTNAEDLATYLTARQQSAAAQGIPGLTIQSVTASSQGVVMNLRFNRPIVIGIHKLGWEPWSGVNGDHHDDEASTFDPQHPEPPHAGEANDNSTPSIE